MALAAGIGRKLKGGEIIVLNGDLGAGKTAFARGLAQGMGSQDTVHSPSFTLSNQYRAGELTLYHFDFYRLSEPGIMRDELAEVISEPGGVTVIEWANIIEDVLPADHCLAIKMSANGETNRRLEFSYSDEIKYLLPTNT